MEPRCKRSMLFLAMAACIVFSVVFTENLTAADIDHDCAGESCPVCLHIETAKGFLKAAGSCTFLAGHVVFPAAIPEKIAECTIHPYSPIALKVRFNS